MLLLDPRVGSGELLPYFKPYDVEVDIQMLDFGDMCFWGQGHDGPLLVGIERKIITDLIASMRSNRLSGHQLPGLLESYAFNYIVIEGIWQCGSDGHIEIAVKGGWTPLVVGSRPVLYREVDHYLATLEHRCGITVKYTSNREQTVAYVVSRYLWWQKDWLKHDSFEAVYAPHEERIGGRRGSFTRRVTGPVELVASQFPGVSKKAYEFGKHFPNVHSMFCNNGHCTICDKSFESNVTKVEGIGKKGANRIYDWLRGKS